MCTWPLTKRPGIRRPSNLFSSRLSNGNVMSACRLKLDIWRQSRLTESVQNLGSCVEFPPSRLKSICSHIWNQRSDYVHATLFLLHNFRDEERTKKNRSEQKYRPNMGPNSIGSRKSSRKSSQSQIWNLHMYKLLFLESFISSSRWEGEICSC